MTGLSIYKTGEFCEDTTFKNHVPKGMFRQPGVQMPEYISRPSSYAGKPVQ